MATTTEADADRKEVMQALIERREVDPEVARRVRERSEALQKNMKALPAGYCVELIRSIRDE